MAASAEARSVDGGATSSARSANVTTATSSPAGARVTASRASCCARANRPGADMLNDVSSATTVARRAAAAAGDGKNGRANASASSDERRDAQQQQHDLPQPARGRALDRRLPQQRHGGELHPRFGSRLSRCSTTGIGRRQRRERESSGDRNAGTIRPSLRAGGQIRQQRHLERLLRVQQLIVDAGAAELAAVAIDELADRLAIVRADDAGHRHHLLGGLEILETRGAIEREVDLVGIEHVEDEDVGTAMVKELQTANDGLGIVEQIGDDDDHARAWSAPRRPAAAASRRWCGCRAGAATSATSRFRRWPGRVLAGTRADDAIVERHQPDAVALPVHQVAERRGQARGVLELARPARPVRHRPADVDQQVTVEVGFLLELLDVVPIAAREDLPVDRREIVAADVLAVLGELDAEALERAAVEARQEAFDDRLRLELERAEARDDGGVEKLPRALAGIATSRSSAPARRRAADRRWRPA